MSKVVVLNGRIPSVNGAVIAVQDDPTLTSVINRTITTIEIPSSVTYIGRNIFNGCTKLTDVKLHQGVTSIDSYAFTGCSALTNINIPDSVSSMGEYVFQQCGLETIELSDNIPRFYQRVFWYCPNLSSVKMPANLTQMDNNVFQYCSKLTYLEIPAKVASIGQQALHIGSSTNKARIRFTSTTPPTIATNTFDTTALERIEVPMAAVDTYKSATNWSNFADLIVGYEEEEDE